ncbi:MAG: hypothetical protein R3F19_08050 [Verrucomicrobiales bacterium]
MAEDNPTALSWGRMLEGMAIFHQGDYQAGGNTALSGSAPGEPQPEGDYSRALAAFEEAGKLNSAGELTGLSTYIGHTLIRLNRIDEGIGLLRQDLARESFGTYAAKAALAEGLYKLGNTVEALQLLAQLKQEAPQLRIVAEVERRMASARSQPSDRAGLPK